MPFLKHFTFLCHQQWPSEKSIRLIVKTPILFLSGAKDELIPPSHMRRLNELSDTRAEKTWVAFPNGMHNDTCMQPGYFSAIRDYLEAHVLKQSKEEEEEKVEEKPKEKKNTLDESYIDGKPVNDQPFQLVSGVTDSNGLEHSFQVEEIELEDEE